MGQYYKAVLIDDKGSINVEDPADYNEGCKLLEHSWIGNLFVNKVLNDVDYCSKRIAWIGDYSSTIGDPTYFNFGNGFIMNKHDFMVYYNTAWNNKIPKKNRSDDISTYLLTLEDPDCFIVNLTKNCYIDMHKYTVKNKRDDCINPFPFLQVSETDLVVEITRLPMRK